MEIPVIFGKIFGFFGKVLDFKTGALYPKIFDRWNSGFPEF
jgi:hypothetical protein